MTLKVLVDVQADLGHHFTTNIMLNLFTGKELSVLKYKGINVCTCRNRFHWSISVYIGYVIYKYTHDFQIHYCI